MKKGDKNKFSDKQKNMIEPKNDGFRKQGATAPRNFSGGGDSSSEEFSASHTDFNLDDEQGEGDPSFTQPMGNSSGNAGTSKRRRAPSVAHRQPENKSKSKGNGKGKSAQAQGAKRNAGQGKRLESKVAVGRGKASKVNAEMAPVKTAISKVKKSLAHSSLAQSAIAKSAGGKTDMANAASVKTAIVKTARAVGSALERKKNAATAAVKSLLPKRNTVKSASGAAKVAKKAVAKVAKVAKSVNAKKAVAKVAKKLSAKKPSVKRRTMTAKAGRPVTSVAPGEKKQARAATRSSLSKQPRATEATRKAPLKSVAKRGRRISSSGAGGGRSSAA